MKVSNKFYTGRTRNVEDVQASACVMSSCENWPKNGVVLAISKPGTEPRESVVLALTNEEAMRLALELIKQAEHNRATYMAHVAKSAKP